MKRVLFVINEMGPGGAERVMSLLVNQGAQNGIEVALAVITGGHKAYYLDERVKIFPLYKDIRGGGVRGVLSRLKVLRSCIKSFRPDSVVSFLTKCNIYSCVAGVGLGVPVIISERNDPIHDCPSRITRLCRNLSYRLAAGAIFQTEDAKACFPAKIQKRSVVISNPVKDGLPLADLDNREKTVVAAGRLMRQKNYPMMLNAFRVFNSTHPEYALHIYGGGDSENQLKELAKELGIADHVIFMGVVGDLHERIVRAGMFVLSSDYEGVSNSLLEALSMGIPCVSTDCPCGGSRYLIEDGVNGLLIPVGDVEKMADAMSWIADNPVAAEQMGMKAREARETHSTAVILKQYYDFIEKNTR